MPTALITGIRGQDGSYLTDLLLGLGYQVHGTSRTAGHPSQPKKAWTLPVAGGAVTMHPCAGESAEGWNELLGDLQPDEVYHFAADSFVPHGWTSPVENVTSNLALPIRLLEAIRHFSPHTKLLNACSREIFGNAHTVVANEATPMNPTTPYGINKAASRWMTNSYRERYGIFAANAILFNHESPRRPEKFVTRKITHGAAAIALKQADALELGNLQARRDWGFAADFVDGMWRILQHESPDDFVLGTGVATTIEQFADLAFDCVGLQWQDHVKTADSLQRHQDSAWVSADYSKAAKLLDWNPKTTLADMVQLMVNSDLQQLRSPTRRAA